MLSLIPAILLLAFHGPNALERLGHGGNLPEALRALERVLAPEEAELGEAGEEGLAKAKKAFAELAALTADAKFSREVAQLFGLVLSGGAEESDESAGAGLDETQSASPIESGICRATQDGFLDNRRSRDGPAA